MPRNKIEELIDKILEDPNLSTEDRKHYMGQRFALAIQKLRVERARIKKATPVKADKQSRKMARGPIPPIDETPMGQKVEGALEEWRVNKEQESGQEPEKTSPE